MNRQTLVVGASALALIGLGIFATLALTGEDSSTMTMGDGSTMPTSDMTTSFDQSFIDAMVPHHQAALAMAKEAKDAGLAEPELVAIADSILATQQREIGQMTGWRKDWFGSSQIDPNGADALGMSMEEMGMTGTAGSFSGAEDVDAAFATAMIAHHEGAITMAQVALGSGERSEIRDLAQEIVSAQTGEIDRMKPYANTNGGMDGMG